jgi:hypothetical protein
MKMKVQQLKRLAALFVIALILPPVAFSRDTAKQLAKAASQSQANLIAASNAYRESLERLLELQKQDEARAAELVVQRKTLLDLGAVSKREVEESEQALDAARARMSETLKQIEEVDRLLAEINAAEPADQPATTPPEPRGSFRAAGALIRYVGASHWGLSDFGKVEAFFRLKFSRSLPVSALGQTETHNRLGFDHRAAIDVAVHLSAWSVVA